jgi:hypothetical protein
MTKRAYKSGQDREPASLLPPRIEDYVGPDNPVRATDAYVEHDLLLNEYSVAEDLGRLTAADLKLPVKLYDPDKHYRAVRGKWIGLDPDR